MSKIAINIAIIPPEEIQDVCIEINKKAAIEGKSTKYLGKDDYLPHITLLMGIVEENVLPEIIEKVNKITSEFNSFNLALEELKESSSSSKENLWIKAEKNSELQKLHEKIVDANKKFLVGDASVECLYKNEESGMSENTKKWLDTYIDNTSQDNFKPHITLRCEKTEYNKLPIIFKVKKVVLFHAGDGCTCRKPIYSFSLQDS